MTGIDWQEATRKGHLMDALYLFACRLAWLRHGDQKARLNLSVRRSTTMPRSGRLLPLCGGKTPDV